VSLLSGRGLEKAFGAHTLFRDVDITINPGDRVGILGVNGAGKSTLLQVLAGVIPVDRGVIDRRRDARILYLEQEPELPAGKSAFEVVEGGLGAWAVAHATFERCSRALASVADDARRHALLAEQARASEDIERLGGWELAHLSEELLVRLGIRDKHALVDTMSGGERRRVALARILVAKPDLALLDEPTNHLDADTIEWLEEYLFETYQGALLFITHDRYVLDTLATRVVEVDRGTLRTYDCGYEDYLTKKEELLALEARTEAKRQNLVRRERAWLRRGAKARTTKQKARISRAEALIETKAPEVSGRMALSVQATRVGNTILETQELAVGYAGEPLIAGLTLNLVAGDRIGIVGPNGIGKTTLFRTFLGELPPAAGGLTLGKNTRIAYVDQARAGLVAEWSLYDNVAGREGAERDGGGEVVFGKETLSLYAYLEQFMFDAHKQRQKVSSLSGGERARVALAKLLLGAPNVLLLDEPTNDLDTHTLAALEDMLVSFGGVVLAISHDRYFLNRVATSILAVERDKPGAPARATLYPGGYDDYLRVREAQRAESNAKDASKRAESLVSSAAPSPDAPTPDAPIKAARPAKLSYKDQRDYETIMDRVAAAEATVSALEAELAKPDVYADAAKAQARQSELETAQAELTRLMTRWEELEALKA
jgi:ATP-binding cassette subfamily F protein uup